MQIEAQNKALKSKGEKEGDKKEENEEAKGAKIELMSQDGTFAQGGQVLVSANSDDDEFGTVEIIDDVPEVVKVRQRVESQEASENYRPLK